MELELKRGGRTARVETLGGELVSYRDCLLYTSDAADD